MLMQTLILNFYIRSDIDIFDTDVGNDIIIYIILLYYYIVDIDIDIEIGLDAISVGIVIDVGTGIDDSLTYLRCLEASRCRVAPALSNVEMFERLRGVFEAHRDRAETPLRRFTAAMVRPLGASSMVFGIQSMFNTTIAPPNAGMRDLRLG
jgi:hypothetical protein